MARPLPPSASVAHAQEGAKLFAPSAERNTSALLDMMRAHAPETGQALEIASGTGQHIAALGAAFPRLHWQPSDVEAARNASIDAYVAQAGLRNVACAITLNATVSGWGMQHGGQDLITLANLLHLISAPEVKTLIREAAVALAPSGTLILYGPFMRAGVLVSDGDKRFHAELSGADPAIGYKDDLDILRWLSDAGLTHTHTIDMPANNLAFVARNLC